MPDYENYYTSRNSAQRFSVVKSNDDGAENYLDIEGLSSFKPTKVLHVQPHGFSSSPVKGAHLIGLNLGGRHDSMVALGGEHPDHKVKKLGGGNTALYNADGTIMKMIGKDLSVDAEGNVTYNVNSVAFKCGGVTLTLDSEGLSVKGGKIKHDDINIGADHTHLRASGPGISGPPVG